MWAAAVVVLGVTAGCQEPMRQAVALHNGGHLEGAVQAVEAPDAVRAMAADGPNQLLWLMEGGKILQDGGAGERSIEVLAQASRLSERFATSDDKPGVVELVGSAVVNPTVRTYRATYSERIRIDAYQVLNQLLAGNVRQAAVYARRTGERQADATVLQAKEIRAAEEEMRTWRDGAAAGQVKAILQSRELQELEVSPSDAAYLDPFASWIGGVAWCATGDAQEFTQGRSNLQEALQMMPDNTFLRHQVQQNPFAAARDGQGQVLVLHEAGVAPHYEQITIPLFTPWTGVSTIPIQVPRYSHPAAPALAIRNSDGTPLATTQLLADYNAIFAAQYHRMLPEIIFGTLVMIAVKEGATVGGYLATQGSSGAQLGVLLAASVYKALTNQADLRTWRTPGALMHMAQVAYPSDGVLELSTEGTGVVHRLQLPPGRVILVYVRSVTAGQVRCFCVPIWGTLPPTEAL